MTQIKNKNHYETLKVSPDATALEIKDAFNNLKRVYGEESSAVYSIYSPEERKNLMEEIESAYEALRNPDRRRMYDSALASGSETFSEIISYNTSGTLFDDSPELSELRNDVRYDVKLKEPLVVMDDARKGICEQYRALCAKLEQLNKTKGKTTLLSVTSPREGDGKTTTAMNLAYVMARGFGKKVLLIEGDLKKPRIADLFQLANKTAGLVDILTHQSDFNSCLCRLEKTSLFMVMAGQTADNSAELLALPAFEELLAKLRRRFDYIFIDSPSIIPYADMTVLSELVDGLLLVVRSGKTPKSLIRTAINSMGNSRIIGLLFNDLDTSPNN